MNKEELITAIAEKVIASKIKTKGFLESYIDIVTKALQHGDPIQLVGSCSWSTVERPARKGEKHRTKKDITIPALKVVKFTAGNQLKEGINE